jgi:hypothetical protein
VSNEKQEAISREQQAESNKQWAMSNEQHLPLTNSVGEAACLPVGR